MELSRRLALSEVFNLRPLIRAISLALCLAVSIAGFALTILDLAGKLKLSQNRKPEDREGIMDFLLSHFGPRR